MNRSSIVLLTTFLLILDANLQVNGGYVVINGAQYQIHATTTTEANAAFNQSHRAIVAVKNNCPSGRTYNRLLNVCLKLF